MWKKIRVTILLFILLVVAEDAFLRDGTPSWKTNLYVGLYPINMDGSDAAASAIAALSQSQFDEITQFYVDESQRLGFHVAKPFEVRLGDVVQETPPLPEAHGNMLLAILWSLKFRWWAHEHSPKMLVRPDIKLYLLYFDPATHAVLPHSTALAKGRVGLVNVFASKKYAHQNNVIIAHEMLHTVGATDKYDLQSNQPRFPDGFAEPNKQPLYPQTYAELMGGRIPNTEAKSTIPLSLEDALVGSATAKEIGWTHY